MDYLKEKYPKEYRKYWIYIGGADVFHYRFFRPKGFRFFKKDQETAKIKEGIAAVYFNDKLKLDDNLKKMLKRHRVYTWIRSIFPMAWFVLLIIFGFLVHYTS